MIFWIEVILYFEWVISRVELILLPEANYSVEATICFEAIFAAMASF